MSNSNDNNNNNNSNTEKERILEKLKVAHKHQYKEDSWEPVELDEIEIVEESGKEDSINDDIHDNTGPQNEETHYIEEVFIKDDSEKNKEKSHKFSDDFVDGLSAVLIIILVVSGVVYWLQSMP